MPSAAQSFLLLRFLCRYKEMKLLSGNTDGFDFVFEFNRPTKKDNRLTLSCSLYHKIR